MIKVLHLHTYLNYSCGITRYLESLLDNVSHDFNFSICCTGGDKTGLFIDKGLTVYKMEWSPEWYHTIHYFLKILQVIKVHQINIVHSHHRYFDLIASYAASVAGIPSITTVHSIVRGRRLISYKSDVLITVSDAVKAHIINEFGVNPEKVKVIYNGINNRLYIANSLKKTISDTPIVLGFVGRLSKEKGFDLLIAACRGLLSDGFKFTLVIAGSGEMQKEALEFQAEFPLITKFYGVVSNISIIYGEIDILILPSRVDPFPFTILECGFFKVPVIASRVDGIKEMIEDGRSGRLIPSENIQSLKMAIAQAGQDRNLLRILGENLHNAVLTRFTLQNHIEQLNNLYKEVLLK